MPLGLSIVRLGKPKLAAAEQIDHPSPPCRWFPLRCGPFWSASLSLCWWWASSINDPNHGHADQLDSRKNWSKNVWNEFYVGSSFSPRCTAWVLIVNWHGDLFVRWKTNAQLPTFPPLFLLSFTVKTNKSKKKVRVHGQFIDLKVTDFKSADRPK